MKPENIATTNFNQLRDPLHTPLANSLYG